MNKIFKLVLILTLFSTVNVYAVVVEDSTTVTNKVESTNETQEKTLEVNGENNTQRKLDLEQRKVERENLQKNIEEQREVRKEEVKTKVEEVKANVLTKACEVRLQSLNRVRSESELNLTRNQEINQKILTRLNKISEYLVSKSIDSQTLDGYISEFTSKTDQSKLIYDEYMVMLDDLINSDCSQDTKEIKDNISEMRDKRLEVKKSIIESRDYLRNTIIPYIKTVKNK